MNIIYNEQARFQRNNIKEAVRVAQEVLLLDEFYEEVSSIGAFYNAMPGYTGEKISQMMRSVRDSIVTIKVEHYFPGWWSRNTTYKNTNAVVFPGNPTVINLLGHRLDRDVNSLAETLIHEFVHSVDALEEYNQQRRVSWGFTHRGNRSSGNYYAAPNQIGRIGRSYFKPVAGEVFSAPNDPVQEDRELDEIPHGLSKLNYVAVGSRGGYAKKGFYRYSEDDIDQLVNYISKNNIEKLIIYFHGGLVSENNGASAVQRIVEYMPVEGDSKTHTIGFIWKTGIFETIRENLSQVFGKGMAYIALKIILKIVGSRASLKSSIADEYSFTYAHIDRIIFGKEVCPSIDVLVDKEISEHEKAVLTLFGFSEEGHRDVHRRGR